MHLRQQTDYAIRILLCLARNRRIMTMKEIATDTKVPQGLLPRIAQQMRSEGWMSSYAGVGGGYALSCDPKTVTLFEVITLLENKSKINRSLEPEEDIDTTSTIHIVYHGCQSMLDWYWSSVSIADLLNQESVTTLFDRLKEEMKEYGLDGEGYVTDKMG